MIELNHIAENCINCPDSSDACAKSEENGQKVSEQDGKKEQKEPWWKVRYMAVLFGFLGAFFLYLFRITMSMSIVAMVEYSTSLKETEFSTAVSCPHLIAKNDTQEKKVYNQGEFSWPAEIQGYILGSSYICYIIAMPFLAKIAELYGGKKILLSSIFFSSLFTFLSPFAARYSVYLLIFVQILRGIAQGGIIPANSILLANWCTKQERGYSMTIAITGFAIGAVVGGYLTGVLCDSAFTGGWPSAFYVNGSLGFITSICMLFFLYDNPSVHPRISSAEREYIFKNQENVLTQKRPKTPWKCLFTSVPVYALSYAYFGEMWAMSHFLTVGPTFLKTILHYSVEQDGLFTSLPFLLQIITSHASGILSTQLIKRKCITVDKARKLWTFLSTCGYSICVLGIYFAGCNRNIVVVLSLAALSFIGFSFSGSWIVCVDMSPTFAGSISAISCSIGSLSHFILPVVVGYLTNDSQTIEQWQKVFLISIGVVSLSGVLFAIFGSAEIQPWNEISEEESLKSESRLHNNILKIRKKKKMYCFN